VERDVRSVAEAYYAGLAALDLDALSAALMPDVRAEAPGVTFESREQLLAWMQGFFDAFPGIEHVGSTGSTSGTGGPRLTCV
jgi:hypothetical protein